MKVVIIVIEPTIGSINELETPTSTPPLATTWGSSPPDDDRPNAVLIEVRRLILESLMIKIPLRILLLLISLLILKHEL